MTVINNRPVITREMGEYEEVFTMREIKPIAMIRDDVTLEAHLKKLNQYWPKLSPKIKELEKSQIWYAFERCGFTALNIPNYLQKKMSLEPFSFHVSGKQWKAMSICRKDTLMGMFSCPNGFFYRNRPPGGPLNHGTFKDDEVMLFEERMALFKHFDLENKFWGFFSVPFNRYGYTCAAYYRLYYSKTPHHKTQPSSIPVKSQEDFLKYLFDESLQKILFWLHKNYSLSSEQQANPYPNIELDDDDFLPIFKERRPKRSRKSKEVTEIKKTPRKRNANIYNRRLVPKAGALPNIDKEKISILAYPEIFHNLALGARDVVTGRPMKKPHMNREGFVLDSSTWESIFEGSVSCPCPNSCKKMSDLIVLTDENFENYKPFIRNMPF